MKTLFEETKLGNISIQNRFLRSATWENMTTEDGHLTDKLYKIYENLAKSGVGLIITGYANIVKEEQPNHGMMRIYDDSFIDEYKKLTNIVHNYNSKIIMQVAYGGTKTKFNHRRTDEYGGSLANRMRFLLEIYNKVREKAGDKFTILIKLTSSEFFQGGLTFDETKLICKKLEEVGVDAIEITGNIHGKAKSMVGEVFDGYRIQEEGYFTEYAKIISNEINIPIITVGGFKNIDKIEKLLNETNIDFFGLSRPLLAEPDLIKRWKSGDRKASICLSCSKCRTSKGNYCTIFNTCVK
ncbi:NADH-dependent flavin oxidoreductase [Clostridium pasteurianum DSM 525 = ATCC 6013]|uniref:NADH-dependent flavin oxidoreductase n=1 Tax=Clostridium pasteurianum DSM 525 = ATCC 6013 TaxID=1262449 RepID=A0A0H3JAS2_CLOPA|nr:NADH:flavin oxidoreductase [Clostridium pasteurianum]AJA48810.1 NADH-dependent flavin oxidoreductase [Clostridium pasteurianum DSM 525 = ATCC 6013]AJA52798.1 NADH-dependent flavin oxidoreductase [Clostridium pasteurianum DSM 525 = ATCC 6013]AOZ76027.1 oxidoreductase [Clostridium pasteurianum DSM 525 = ATCC 6013]AOZ79823.1 oxidoreductase [Clostridium pasteurianum]ELP60106.1 NADH-dependent flavin oxidoreductase [Clostridium pasteurianum DSM 525 = ATCC 6013]